MSNSYIVWTKEGYYYTTGNGRYGRVNGKIGSAEVMCEKHALAIRKIISDVPECEARLEQVATRGCLVCKRNEGRQ